MMTNKQIAMGAALGAATFGGLHAAGYSGDSQASIPGTTFSINAEIIKYALTLAAMFLPKLAEKLLPGLGPIVTKLLAMFSKDQPVVAPVPVPSPAPEKPHAPCLCDDLDHLADISRRLEDPAAKASVAKIANDLFVANTEAKPDAKKPQ
jgi:hypothetical protein